MSISEIIEIIDAFVPRIIATIICGFFVWNLICLSKESKAKARLFNARAQLLEEESKSRLSG